VGLPHVSGGRPARLCLRARGDSQHTKLELCCRSIASKPAVDVHRRQGSINSLNPKIASYLGAAAVCPLSNANTNGFHICKQHWKPPRGIKARVNPGLGPRLISGLSGTEGTRCGAAGSCVRSPCRDPTLPAVSAALPQHRLLRCKNWTKVTQHRAQLHT